MNGKTNLTVRYEVINLYALYSPQLSRQTKSVTAKPKSSWQNKKLTAKQKANGKPNTRERCCIRGSWTLIIVRAKVFGVKSKMAALSSQMFCSNCGAEAALRGNF